ncbi:MAG: serine hydrolase [Neomegalonema sp.]|nr:serine hydrolase [Neomegalonema sp.]
MRLDFATFSVARTGRRALIAALFLLGGALSQSANAQGLSRAPVAAPFAYIVDAHTNVVLFQRRADVRFPPASLSKLMTAAMAFDALAAGEARLEQRCAVSRRAAGKPGSSMRLAPGERPTIAQLLRGVIVLSGNDAAIALAECLSGAEDRFAAAMTARARAIGLTRSSFGNATGWPDPRQRMTARDLGMLALYIIRKHPDLYPIYAQKSFTWAGRVQKSRNPLLYADKPGDGLKTGYTRESGYGLVGSAERRGRRVVIVVAGLRSSAARAREAARAMRWAFARFRNVALARKGEVVGEIGSESGASVPVRAGADIMVTVRVKAPVQIIVERLAPPLINGSEIAIARVGRVIVKSEGLADQVFPLLGGKGAATGPLRLTDLPAWREKAREGDAARRATQ